MQDPPIWQRLLAALAYLLPWSDAFSFGRGLFGLFPALQWLGVPILPIALLEQAVPLADWCCSWCFSWRWCATTRCPT